MTLNELMDGFTPNANYEGAITNDDFVIAINTGESSTDVGDYVVAQAGIVSIVTALTPISQTKSYMREGQSTVKTATQRTFAITGDRIVGDEFQEYVLSTDNLYGIGQNVITDYVRFCLKNGKGEKGKVSIIVNADGSGNTNEPAAIDVSLQKVGATPEVYTWTVV
ncbi:MAG: hypothetical protein LBL82_01145 [Oscillospiraceae bacterium]|jgi:hypothetical protein|nr:hypothetical protein [Oscillospiraceae bacterium]